MLSICRENPEICNVKESSLKDFQPPIVLIKHSAAVNPLQQMISQGDFFSLHRHRSSHIETSSTKPLFPIPVIF
jgi:hypothetical protein